MTAELIAAAAAGAIGGIAADKVEDVLPDLPGAEDHARAMREHLRELSLAARHALAYLDQLGRPAMHLPIALAPAVPVTLETRGRPHNALWSAAAQTISIDVPGAGACSYALAVGWNPLDLPDGCRFGLPQGATTVALLLLRLADTSLDGRGD